MRASAEGAVLTVLGPTEHLVFRIRLSRAFTPVILMLLVYVIAVITASATKCRAGAGGSHLTWSSPGSWRPTAGDYYFFRAVLYTFPLEMSPKEL